MENQNPPISHHHLSHSTSNPAQSCIQHKHSTTPSPSPPPQSPFKIKIKLKSNLIPNQSNKRSIDLLAHPHPNSSVAPSPTGPSKQTKLNNKRSLGRLQTFKTLAHDDPSLKILPTLEELCDQDKNLPSHLTLQLQTTTCVTLPAHLKRYRCSPCTGKSVGFICAFRFIRQWICRRDSPQIILGGPTFPAATTHPTQLGYRYPNFPSEFNRLPTKQDLNELRQLLARILLPAIQVELEWLKDPNVKFIGRRIDLVTKCDYCSATLIGAAWLCTQCGAEACLRCFEKICLQVQTIDSSVKSTHMVAHLDWLKRLTTCTKLHQSRHTPSTHIKISHITLDELELLHQQMLPLTLEPSPSQIDHTPPTSTLPNPNPYSVPLDLDRYLYRSEVASSEPYIRIHANELEADPSIFDRLWSTGQMILVQGMNDRLKLEWTPSFFVWSRPHETCQRIDSSSKAQIPVNTTVGEFFGDFEKDPSEIRQAWKLRDWPPEADFKTKFPQLFNDFQQALPIPDITTRFGIRNVAAHFPQNANVPDIGPKMYIAMKNSDQAGSNGSTVLHMDVADAINIQTYAKADQGGQEGCALWHLYHAKDSEKLRDFLYQHQAASLGTSVEQVKANYDDPIHTTRIYIDAEMRKTLREQYGVTGWEVEQKPGDAIFIPAYTAHQVCNLANCIKVAADFVSPHSITRCIKLAEEFRVQNHERRTPWREDLLQINQMLLYAFQSSGRNHDKFQIRK